jgi:hypothetical protein
MKKLYFSALSLLSAFGLNAQITITQSNHAPTNGEQFTTIEVDSTVIVPGAGGAGAAWSYTPNSLCPNSCQNNYTSTAGTYTGYGTADMLVAASPNNNSYYKASATELKYWGGSISLGSIIASLTYSSPAIYAVYPMTLTTSTVSAIGGSLTIPSLGSQGTFVGNCTVTADGTGTMTMPAKTFSNTIRVMITQTLNFTIPGAGTGSVSQIQHDYYSLGDSKYPMFTIIQNTISSLVGNSAQKYAFVQKNYQNVGLSTGSKEEISAVVYPNPAASQVNIASSSASAKVTVYDVAGKLVEAKELSNNHLVLDVAAYHNGIYIFKITDSNSKAVKTGRFTVSH